MSHTVGTNTLNNLPVLGIGANTSRNLQIRAEFRNIFNRAQVNDPTSTNSEATQQRNAAGKTTAGFGLCLDFLNFPESCPILTDEGCARMKNSAPTS